MKRRWATEELVEQCSLEPNDEQRMLFHKEKNGRRLGLLAQLAFYRRVRRFPEHRSDLAPAAPRHSHDTRDEHRVACFVLDRRCTARLDGDSPRSSRS